MVTNLVRFGLGGAAQWGVVSGSGVSPLAGDYPTTAALIERGQGDWLAVRTKAASLSLDKVRVLSPVTTPCRIYCQGANYRQHMIESGMNPDAKTFNMIFSKAPSCIVAADSDVVRPRAVHFLDYEIELGLVLGRDVTSRQTVKDANLHEYVAGAVIVNDYSARDI